MNPAVHIARAGMGLFIPDDIINEDFSRPRTIETGGSAPPWWAVLGPSIISTAGVVTRDIFAPSSTSQAAYGAQASRFSTLNQPRVTSQVPPPGYTYDEYGRLVRIEGSGGIGAGLERFIRDNSTILLVGAGLLVLIQMPGFTRRGR